MKTRLKNLYDCFYTPPEFSEQKQEMEECHQALIKVLEKPERRLVLRIMDAQSLMAEERSIDSFVSGFELAWQLSMELNQFEKRALSLSLYSEEIERSFHVRNGGSNMKKRIITVAAFAACLALCAAVWPQKQPVGETPALSTPAAVIATQPEVPKMPEMKEVITPEEEKSEATLQELVEEADIVPEPSPAQAPPESELQAPSEQNATPQQEPEPAPAPDSEPDNMVYVPGFGWIESQGPNHAEYAEDMYENGNKIGIMG